LIACLQIFSEDHYGDSMGGKKPTDCDTYI
jgi:hypothetical protein